MRRYTRFRIRSHINAITNAASQLAEIAEDEAKPVSMRRGPRFRRAVNVLDEAVVDLMKITKQLGTIR